MYLLAELFPAVRRVRLPVSRDQAMLILLAVMEIAMGVEIYTGHKISGTIVPNEWIPIIYGPLAGILLILAGLIARRNRPPATVIATLTFLGSILVGLLGTYFHLQRAIIPGAPAGQQISMDLLIWAPPIIAPLMFALIGVLGISAVWTEEPADSGVLTLPGGRLLHAPFSKTRAFLLWVGLAMLATVISSVLDHARANFQNPWLWIPTSVGIFATAVTVFLGFLEKPGRADLTVYLIALALMIIVGPVGVLLHIQADLTAGGVLVWERLLKGAPAIAPMLFSNMGMLGFLILLDPTEQQTSGG